MKSSHTLMAAALFAVIASSFIVPGNSNNKQATGPVRNKYVQWKHTTWVNPFTSALTTARVDFSHECTTPSLVYKYRIFINSNEYPGCGIPMGVDTYYPPAGTNVSLEMEVAPIYGAYYILIDDYDGMGGSTTLFYADSPNYITYNFPVAAGHTYYVYTMTY